MLNLVSYHADVEHQFVRIQKRLEELDLLNEWATPIGSAVFAIPPECPAVSSAKTSFAEGPPLGMLSSHHRIKTTGERGGSLITLLPFVHITRRQVLIARIKP